ncbi:MAG: glycosyltransferase family 2 protein [Magnetococcales bacterium]|nr:glycosyltransferase family 2 protein [Magnetococcales bacterium]
MERHQIGIVIPAYNEEQSILQVIEKISRFGLPIVVNDASVDQTAAIARNAGAEVVTHASNQGYDAALNSGFARAEALGCQWVITIDADGQHPPELLQTFIDHLQAGADLVAGIRNEQQRLAEWLFSLFTRWRYGLADPLCGMKGYQMSLYRQLGHFDAYQSIGTELLLFALHNGRRCVQVPVMTRKRVGVSRFGRALLGNYRILRAMLLALVTIRTLPTPSQDRSS